MAKEMAISIKKKAIPVKPMMRLFLLKDNYKIMVLANGDQLKSGNWI